ncbi:MAG TPA: (Fe-S)-binding protein, partial [Bacillales bacterium]|nr:(Fe-S)-binding protein [Bacillales bacterium]
AKQMIKVFAESEYVVAPSGSCAAMVHEYEKLFAEDPKWREKAASLAEKTYEFTQFLVDVLKVDDVGARFSARGAYHTSCHMTRLLGVEDAPMRLLHHVEGLELVPFANAYDCCGFGGTFSVKMPAISAEMADEKIRHVEGSDAEVLIGADSGCLMHLQGRMSRLGKPVEVKHVAQVLNMRK